jgi:2-polyprenyl-3-methyl-5-hydroxy-6-metoxy-1,4-benzoquinol methylase
MGAANLSSKERDKATADKAGADYWNRLWEAGTLPAPIDPFSPGARGYYSRQFHRYFEGAFGTSGTQGLKFVEVGCAQSVYLPYFAKYFGFVVSGLDRSSIGCEKARRILEREGVKGEVYCADLFSLPPALNEQFDVLASFGVIEHYPDTAECVKAMARLLKPNGRMATVVPNLAGILRPLQKMIDRSVYDIHVPLDREGVLSAHLRAGLVVERCDYFLPFNLGVVNLEKWRRSFLIYNILRSLRSLLSNSFWLVDEHLVRLPASRRMSPNINCVARKPSV